MIIDSGCVILRAIEKNDMEFLQDMINDPAIENMTIGGAFPVSFDRQVRWFESYDQQKELRCMIDIKDGATIGMIMLTDIDWKNRTAVLGQKTKAKHEERKDGDIIDAMMGFLNYAFNELNLNCIYGTVLEYNMLSRKLAAKCGLKEEGILRQRIFKRGKYHNIIANSVIKQEFIPIYNEYKQNRRKRNKV
ncbi:GNAT family N-acetyltransferase [Clostridium botulinum]|nr:GNAT family N-acetyltransferase [Clostridium botulinum]NFI18615.1 GNAT family N-acetyltransferase [Clostridium botulinum]NFL93231.1 GNAT family N-acetyltransferase [Clostridium botulinum]NFN52793.1 GNAT family N-acetyltransferase [Clostridium botulinum]NFO27760.1 GNAT family N-acetyltransferase [Clostridium botulinum]